MCHLGNGDLYRDYTSFPDILKSMWDEMLEDAWLPFKVQNKDKEIVFTQSPRFQNFSSNPKVTVLSADPIFDGCSFQGMGWGDSLAGRMLAVQAGGPEFDLQDPCKHASCASVHL